MEETFSKLIDHSLNWNTASQKGYSWEIDVILDKDGKVIVPNNLMVLLKNEKYKLGEPWAEEVKMLCVVCISHANK